MSMLEILRRVVQEVNAAPDLDQALAIIVGRVKEVMAVDVCSVYLAEHDTNEYVLRASDGLPPEVVGRVRLPMGTGLVGLVGERAEPINLADGQLHRRFRFVPDTGEERLHGFLGAPIIRHRKVLGVLIAQREAAEDFTGDEVSFAVTLAAQIAGAITHAETVGEVDRSRGLADGSTRYFEGLPGAPGVAIGQTVIVYPEADLDSVPEREAADPQAEEAIFLAAVHGLRHEIEGIGRRMADRLSADDRAVFDAYCAILSGDTLVTDTVARIREGQWAPSALKASVESHARVFAEMTDPYLAERARDLHDLGRRILMRLQVERTGPQAFPERAVLVGESVSVMQLAEASHHQLAGVVSVHGSGYSHVAILARALGIPAVMGVSDLPVGRMGDREIIADGYKGRVYLQPSAAVRDEYERLLQEEAQLSRNLEELRPLPAVTPDGMRVPLYVNAGLLADVASSLTNLAEGIGLYRTEFPFLIRDRFPGEEEQYRIYREALEGFAPGPVTLRTLDAGGDKALPYFPIEEPNPFLGWRGIRLTLDHPEIFLTQLRAMLRANVGLGNLRVLLPMISSVREVDEAWQFLFQVHDELSEEGLEVTVPPLGVMVEVPSLVYQMDALARRVDFLSVGTNDLTQYLLAVDRNNERVAELYDHLHPSVIRALCEIVDRAHACGKPVSVCGEMADDPMAAILLIGMGIDSLSMSAGSLGRIKWVVRTFSRVAARRLLQDALLLEEAHQIRLLLTNALDQNGLGGLVRAGM